MVEFAQQAIGEQRGQHAEAGAGDYVADVMRVFADALQADDHRQDEEENSPSRECHRQAHSGGEAEAGVARGEAQVVGIPQAGQAIDERVKGKGRDMRDRSRPAGDPFGQRVEHPPDGGGEDKLRGGVSAALRQEPDDSRDDESEPEIPRPFDDGRERAAFMKRRMGSDEMCDTGIDAERQREQDDPGNEPRPTGESIFPAHHGRPILPLMAIPRNAGGVAGIGEAAIEPDGRAIKGGHLGTDGRVGQVLAGFFGGFEGLDDGGFVPMLSLAERFGVKPGAAESSVVGLKMSDGGGVEAGILAVRAPLLSGS